LQGKLDFEAGEPQEVAVVGAKRGAVLDGQGGEMSVHDKGTTRAALREQSSQDLPMPMLRADSHDIIPAKPRFYHFDGFLKLERTCKKLRGSR